MVSSSEMHDIRVTHLPSQKCQNNLQWEWSSINKVTVKQVRSIFAWITINIEYVQQIIVLSMSVSTYCEGLIASNIIL